jgi:hypothetical protein
MEFRGPYKETGIVILIGTNMRVSELSALIVFTYSYQLKSMLCRGKGTRKLNGGHHHAARAS